jgi:hypothetical protein
MGSAYTQGIGLLGCILSSPLVSMGSVYTQSLQGSMEPHILPPATVQVQCLLNPMAITLHVSVSVYVDVCFPCQVIQVRFIKKKHICCSPDQTINTQAVNWYILTYLNTLLMLSKFSNQFKIGINEFIYALNFPNHMFHEFVFLSLNNICKPQDMSAIGAMICACYVIVSRF